MCLRDDFRLYYNGTYVSKVVNGRRVVLYVEDVTGGGAQRPDQVTLIGHEYTWDKSGFVENGRVAWTGNEIEPFVPESGYYKIGPSGTPGYLEYIPQNRTNRKGFEASRVTVNNRGVNLPPHMVARVFCDDTMQGRIGTDMCVFKSRFFWRGDEVGTFHDGVLTLNESVQYLQEYAQKLVNQFLSNQGG